ncbi:unnamed protein product [Haemonchus placei]|uniref:Astacin domain-containing protein n=1 Tax=Haemonchus placei TaxID=6290 RepID=A0A158QNI2_HAEPC|nr:unnamed protein product [Haemonchus placei]
MLGHESLLVAQSLAIFLFGSPLSEACADCVTLAPGQEKVINFEENDFNLPLQMMYSTNRKAKVQALNMSATKEQALRAINNIFEIAMHDGISHQLAVQGLSMEVLKQIQYMPSTYDPLQCNDVAVAASYGQVVEFDSESSGSVYNCGVISNPYQLASVCQSTKCTILENTIPQEFLTYKGSLKKYALFLTLLVFLHRAPSFNKP